MLCVHEWHVMTDDFSHTGLLSARGGCARHNMTAEIDVHVCFQSSHSDHNITALFCRVQSSTVELTPTAPQLTFWAAQ